jgi:hypothetical protein
VLWLGVIMPTFTLLFRYFLALFFTILIISPLFAVGKIQIKTTNTKKSPDVEAHFNKLVNETLLSQNKQTVAKTEMELAQIFIEGYTSFFSENFKGAYDCYKHGAELGWVPAKFGLIDLYDVYKFLPKIEQELLNVELERSDMKKLCHSIIE